MSEAVGLQMKYFVLKPAGDDAYANASRKALLAYARAIEDENLNLAGDLIEWAHREQNASAGRSDHDR